MKYHNEKVTCQKCGRKILVEMFLIGTPHHTCTTATCAECMFLPFNEEFVRENPQEAANIKRWLAGEPEEPIRKFVRNEDITNCNYLECTPVVVGTLTGQVLRNIPVESDVLDVTHRTKTIQTFSFTGDGKFIEHSRAENEEVYIESAYFVWTCGELIRVWKGDPKAAGVRVEVSYEYENG